MRKPASQPSPAPVPGAAPAAARPVLPVWLLAAALALVTVALYWPASPLIPPA